MKEETVDQLESLARDLYAEGDYGGPIDPVWFRAWAMIMIKVVEGCGYNGEDVITIYQQLKESKQNV